MENKKNTKKMDLGGWIIIAGIVLVSISVGIWVALSLQARGGDMTGGQSVQQLRMQDIRGATIDAELFTTLLDSVDNERVHLVDIRTYEELMQTGVIGDPINVDYYDPQTRAEIASRDADDIYLIYCRTGSRSGDLRRYMSETLGMPYVVDLSGGITQRPGETKQFAG